MTLSCGPGPAPRGSGEDDPSAPIAESRSKLICSRGRPARSWPRTPRSSRTARTSSQRSRVRRSGPAAHRQLRRCRAVRRLRRQGGEKVSSRARQRTDSFADRIDSMLDGLARARCRRNMPASRCASAVIRSGRAKASSPHARDALVDAAHCEGIILDSVCTPTALSGQAAAVADGSINREDCTVFLQIGGLPGQDFIHDPQRHPLRTGPVASMPSMAAALSAARSWSLGGAVGSPEEGQQAQVPATAGRLLGTATPTPPPARERAEHPDPYHHQRRCPYPSYPRRSATRATVVTSNRYAARLVFQRVSKLPCRMFSG
jgi:hypothetical protein